MTNNHHDVLPTNAPLNAATLEDRFSDLDTAITALGAGSTSLTGLNLGAATSLIIAEGLVTRTKPRHTIDTQASASADDLTTISGGATGDILIISAANASRVVTVKHGDGNIFLSSKLDRVLDDTDKQIMLVYNGSRWEETNGQHTTALTYPTQEPYRRPAGMPIQLTPAARTNWGVRAAAATIQANGIAAPTVSATTTAAANQADSTYVSYATSNVANNAVTIVSATYNLARRSHNPKMSIIIQLADIISQRLFLGFSSAALTNADTVAGATEFAGFRFSTNAGEIGFVPVTKDATTQTTGTAMNTVAALTRYLLEIELTSSSAIFTIDNGTPTVVAATLPAAATELGFNIYMATLAASIRTLYFSRLFCEQN